ncbi:MAG: UDP-N-acetylglucosamine 1-carboxyvinyltransferase, partial [Thermoprotei archaeon]
AILATQAEGTTLIHDTMYEGRFAYINELNKMGANAIICDPHRALITGSTPLYGQKITSFDLRAGATLIIAALLAKGQSVIEKVEQVDRGYERIEERLKALGADIKRER